MERIKTARDITPSNFFDEFQTYNRQEREAMAVKLMKEYNHILDYRDECWDDEFMNEALSVMLTYIERVFDIMHLPVEKRFKYNVE